MLDVQPGAPFLSMWSSRGLKAQTCPLCMPNLASARPRPRNAMKPAPNLREPCWHLAAPPHASPSARHELATAQHGHMSTADHSRRDLSRACWRCTHWVGFAHGGMSHSKCSRLNATPIQASPAMGCASWQPGAGDNMPARWIPVGFVPWAGPTIYGAPPEPVAMPNSERSERPYLPCDRFQFNQQSEAAAWRVADSLISRARRP